MANKEVFIRAAMDLGAAASVCHPDDLLSGAEIKPNTAGWHFTGAGGFTIQEHGSCVRMLDGKTSVASRGRHAAAMLHLGVAPQFDLQDCHGAPPSCRACVSRATYARQVQLLKVKPEPSLSAARVDPDGPVY